MKSMLFRIQLLLLLSFFGFLMGVAMDDEVSDLISIKAGLIDPLNSLQDWKLQENDNSQHSTPCHWTGVSCNSKGEVEQLDLSRMNLTGNISKDIQKLQSLSSLNICGNSFSNFPLALLNITSLKSIDISQNYFVDFPDGFGRLVGLEILNASSNNLSASIPEDLSNATALQVLDLRGNFFQGSIPSSLKSLQKLKFLGLSGNNLTGTIPGELGQLSSLESIILGYNEFEGGIPAEFGNLTNLKYLDLAVGNLGGEIPADLGRLDLLETIYLYNNNFEGKIPPAIGNISSLQWLDLSDNMLSGEIPDEISRLKNLQLLNLMCNQLSGSIPPRLVDLTQLQVLELWNNSFSGTLPSSLGSSSPLQWLDVSSNKFLGPIPANLCRAGNLTKLILFNNAFTGPIPMSLSKCVSLVRVRMQNNLISGTIPAGFGKLEKLQRLELGNNGLMGAIPNDLGLSTSLSFVDFSQNLLQSSLPSTILSIPSLQSFIASNNNLSGEIPDQFQDCPALTLLDLSSNHLTGHIPASISSCEKLVKLNLRNNQLTGEIPTAIAMMPTLAILDLSNNSLTGQIPEDFGSTPALEAFNASYNRLEGPVPANGVLRTINPDDLVGNAGLCGSVLPPCAGSSSLAMRQRILHAKHVIAGWIIGISSALAILVALMGARNLYIRWYSNGNCFEERLDIDGGEWPWRLMAFQRLGFTSADILSSIKESNVIGKGGTGTVYKAEVPRMNTVVAVKKLWSSGIDIETGSSSNFVAEVQLLGKLRHRNIVRLLGFLHNNTDAMIVYEYMDNGSLGEALHGKQAGKLLVDWVSRYNIALGIAQGLAYLHHDCHPSIIHRDIKSNNILLDANLEARIADFGLARMMLRKKETVSMVAGSYGYIAPEYGYTLKVDEKIDIYSFGVVLLELITGKPPLDPGFGESVDIVEWVRRRIGDNRELDAVLDPSVGNCKHVQEEMLLVLRIALLCTAKLPRDRPSMRDVITMLGEAKPRRKSSSNGAGSETQPVFSTSPMNGLL